MAAGAATDALPTDFVNTTGNTITLKQIDGSLRTIEPSPCDNLTVVCETVGPVAMSRVRVLPPKSGYVYGANRLPPRGAHIIVSASVALNLQANDSWFLGYNIYSLSNDTHGGLIQWRTELDDKDQLDELLRRTAILKERGTVGPND